MDKPIPEKISQKRFQDVLAGKKGFISKNITDNLKAKGLSRLLHKKEVTRDEALKALKILQAEETISKFERPDELYRHAGIAQRDADEIARNEVIHKHARLAIQQEIEEEAFGQNTLNYDKRGLLGKSVYEELNDEQATRDKKSREEITKLNKFNGKNPATPGRPEKLDLPDMDIG